MSLAEKSFSLFPNQLAKYNIAISKEYMGVHEKVLVGAKKKQEARDEIIEAFLATVKMDPNSDIAKDAGSRLINTYKHEFKYHEVFN